MQRLSKSCHFMHLMQNRCSRIPAAQEGGGGGGEVGGSLGGVGASHYTA